MNKREFKDRLKGFTLLDGAMGTMIQQRVLPYAEIPELYNLRAPEVMQEIHKEYVDAGSDIIYANTFGANPLKIKDLNESLEEIIQAGIQNAKEAVKGTDTLVALDVGPTGQLLEPMGTLSFEAAYDAFASVVKAGVKAGADLIVIETMTDLYETKAALLAAKENSDLPVLVSMTFEANGRTFTGCSLEAMALTLESLQADAIGLNCSLGPSQMVELIDKLSHLTSLPVLAKPNAGLPDPRTGKYAMSLQEFEEAAKKFIESGVNLLGGCCGTNPEHIQILKKLTENKKPVSRDATKRYGVCSASKAFYSDQVGVVGERINPTGKKRFAKALLDQDLDVIARFALEQKEAGADLLDVNVGYPGVDEEVMLPAAIKKIQSVCDLPLILDSSNPKALENGLRVVNGKAAINSVNGKEESLNTILPIAAKYNTCLVALCLDDEGIPEDAQKRIEIAKKIIDRADQMGIDKKDLWIDALTLTLSAQQDQALETLQTVEWADLQGIPTILGVSNISFGLPLRILITQTFLIGALSKGLRLAIINPNTKELMDAVAAFKVINNQDKGARAYIDRFALQEQKSKEESRRKAQLHKEPSESASGFLEVAGDHSNESENLNSPQSESNDLIHAIKNGMESEAAHAARNLLNNAVCSELDITEKYLIPALDQVGQDYENGILYLPQLLSAAGAAQKVFEVLKESMAEKGTGSIQKGKIVLATVKGDIHDIGKNIVKTLLENYGYQVIDLGRDTDPQLVLETVEKHQIRLVGLSALMTTTIPSMEETIALLHTLKNPPVIMVGGAVLTQEAAKDIKADYYAKDARASVAIARKVFGQ